MPGSRYPLLAVTVTCRCDSDSEPPGRYASEKLKGPEILDGIDSRRNSNPIHDIRELESARGRSNVAGPGGHPVLPVTGGPCPNAATGRGRLR